MKNQIVASIAAIPFAVGTVFAGTGAANAAGLYGSFNMDGGNSTEVELSENTFSFDPNPGQVEIFDTTGSFNQFDGQMGTIQGPIDLTKIDSDTYQISAVTNPFLDFGGGNLFSLDTGSTLDIVGFGSNVTFALNLEGTFTDANGIETVGSGILSIQKTRTSVQDITNILDGNSETETFSFSGDMIGEMTVSTPEPTTLFGLGVVATGLVASRRKKNS